MDLQSILAALQGMGGGIFDAATVRATQTAAADTYDLVQKLCAWALHGYWRPLTDPVYVPPPLPPPPPPPPPTHTHTDTYTLMHALHR
jgi:hypothetical protein